MNTLNNIDPYDWSTIAPFYETLQAQDLTSEGTHDWLLQWSDLERVIGEAGSVAARAMSEDTADEAAKARYLQYIQEIDPQMEIAGQVLKTKLLGLADYTPAIDEEQLLLRIRSEAQLFREANVPLHAEIATVVTDYDEIAGAMTVTLDGEEQTLQQAEQRLLDPDRTAREASWRATQTRWLQDRPTLDALYLRLREMRQRLAQNAGMPDYRAYRWQELQRFDYTPDESLAFGRAIETHVVPLATQRREKHRRHQGLDTLRPWDLSVDPLSRPPLRPFQKPDQLEELTARIFDQIDPELGSDFGRVRDGFLDLGSRRNKAPGGYCSFFPKTGLPYIFMNAVGTHDDVQTLLHEGGHAFHAIASNEHQSLIWNIGAPSEFAEVASMGMEMLALPYLAASRGGFYTPEDAARAQEEHLERIIQFFPYMAVVDGFQHWVYAEAGPDMTAADMDRQWAILWDRFLPGLDWDGFEAEKETGWHRKLHIFQYPFYYVEYGLAQLGALQVWRNAMTDQAAALGAYRSALALGNTRSLPELFEAAGAHLAFDADTVGELTALVAAHLPE
jgi:oligoendopeptidase F